MKIRKITKLFIFLGTFLVIAVIVVSLLILLMDTPPVELYKNCGNAISKAKTINADVYAPEQYNVAEKGYNDALIEWKRQNEKIFFRRNFSKTKEIIISATIKAEEAIVASGQNKDTMKEKYLQDIQFLKTKIESYHDFFIKLPLRVQTRKDYEFGKLSIEESLSAFEKGEVMAANKKLTAGEIRISKADIEVNNILKDYFSQFAKWQKWVQTSISHSAQNNCYVLIVDKIKHKGMLYFNGKLHKEYDVELGKNWIGVKQYSGDFATPEGIYSITKKKGVRDTKYYKALLINYPNSEDRENYNAKVGSGDLSSRRGIGGLIEIHGDGGKGADWTDGCVALRNSDMDELFSKISVGTTITIVGSTVQLAELLK